VDVEQKIYRQVSAGMELNLLGFSQSNLLALIARAARLNQ